MVTQILNFGIPTQLDVEVQGRDRAKNIAIAQELQRRMAAIPGVVDAHLQQELDAPELFYDIDRTRAQQLNQTVSAISNNLMISLSSSEQVTPNFWTDPNAGIPYFLAVQTPEYRIASLNDLNNTSIASSVGDSAPIPNTLANVARFERRSVQSVINHSNVQRVYDVYASVQDRDLGGVAADIRKIVDQVSPRLTPGNRILVRGQVDSMESAFSRLTLGLILDRKSVV